MKKLFMVLAAATLSFGAAFAQEANEEAAQQANVEQVVDAVEADEAAEAEEAELQGEPMHFSLLKKFLEGGWGWMLLPLICLILGMAIAVERILFLALSKINTKKFIARVEEILNAEGVEAAKAYCRNTRGPVASIFYQGGSQAGQGREGRAGVVTPTGIAPAVPLNLGTHTMRAVTHPHLGNTQTRYARNREFGLGMTKRHLLLHRQATQGILHALLDRGIFVEVTRLFIAIGCAGHHQQQAKQNQRLKLFFHRYRFIG